MYLFLVEFVYHIVKPSPDIVVICAPEAVSMPVITDFGHPSEPLRWCSIDVQL